MKRKYKVAVAFSKSKDEGAIKRTSAPGQGNTTKAESAKWYPLS
jgi:hypothetical protein